MIPLERIKQEIASFADDERDVMMDKSGHAIIERHGKTIEFRLSKTESGISVLYNDIEMPYSQFIAKELAHLDILASKLIDRHSKDNIYVDPQVTSVYSSPKDKLSGQEMLQKNISEQLFGSTKITFVTADAGHGKTALLKEFELQQAKRYSSGESNYLFLHIDLHGRDLVRLNEAIMYDLGELRFSGIYYSSILTLIKENLLVLGIDGFDELAAEVGGEGALGSLASLVSKMEGEGTLIAASRRTFFNTQDYIRRANFLNDSISAACEFNELKINNWGEKECVEYLSYFYDNAEDEYIKMLEVLGKPNHPLLERPYLFTKIVNYSNENGEILPSAFISSSGNTLVDANDIIEAFIKREVIKWKERDKDTGKPYLTFEQHLRLLSEIAQEMWSSQKDIISVEHIQFLLTMLFEEWDIDSKIKPIIVRMVESHALLVRVDGKDKYRKFDHEEFRYFFIARALQGIIKEAIRSKNNSQLSSFLYVAQLPDSVAQYLALKLPKEDVLALVDLLMSINREEWKPTYVQPNIGTIIPYILNNFTHESTIEIGEKFTFSSLIFENKSLENIVFENCTFINISFKNTILTNIYFINCTFTDIRIYDNSGNKFTSVRLAEDCTVNKVTIIKDDETYSEYSPQSILKRLQKNDITVSQPQIEEAEIAIEQSKNTEFKKCTKRFLNKFLKSTYQYETAIKNEPIFGLRNANLVLDEIIPLLEKHGIIVQKDNKKTAQASSKAWVLDPSLEDIFKAEEDVSHSLHQFWVEVNQHD